MRTRTEVLRAATINSATLLGWSDRIGSIEPGKLADIIAVDGDPLKDVKDLQIVVTVFKSALGLAVTEPSRPRCQLRPTDPALTLFQRLQIEGLSARE